MDESAFYSVDRLVEFGLGAAVASQMAASMDQSLQDMWTPGAGNAMRGGIPQVGGRQDVESAVYYVVLDGAPCGPLSLTELARLAKEGHIVRETYVWKLGLADWVLAESMPELLTLMALTPPPIPR